MYIVIAEEVSIFEQEEEIEVTMDNCGANALTYGNLDEC